MNHKCYLTLVRHAHAAAGAGSGGDFERGLDARGQRDLGRVDDLLGALPAPPDVIAVSAAVRGRETAAGILAAFPEWADRVFYDERLYAAHPGDVFAVIGTVSPSCRHVMVVGHNPSLERVAALLVSGDAPPLPTLGVVCLESAAATWDTLPLASARIVLCTRPGTAG